MIDDSTIALCSSLKHNISQPDGGNWSSLRRTKNFALNFSRAGSLLLYFLFIAELWRNKILVTAKPSLPSSDPNVISAILNTMYVKTESITLINIWLFFISLGNKNVILNGT